MGSLYPWTLSHRTWTYAALAVATTERAGLAAAALGGAGLGGLPAAPGCGVWLMVLLDPGEALAGTEHGGLGVAHGALAGADDALPQVDNSSDADICSQPGACKATASQARPQPASVAGSSTCRHVLKS
ncbi:hypothetical protein BDA96_02G162900 [Sorghum bicolor]|uniref:Uncharacterized protein n=2 Tax=Sorghum bicolor TaxID=4558 RepID=A0A921RNT0_SORBI|nr:hypothetical protein BDA96_02G162900 [Sorghum bicolor]KXG35310.1 hypothetical protein SORBI_3002G156300 [Sorghum bicolor]